MMKGRIAESIVVRSDGSMVMQCAGHLRGDIGPTAVVGTISGTFDFGIDCHWPGHVKSVTAQDDIVLRIVNRAMQLERVLSLADDGRLVTGDPRKISQPATDI